jgi:3-oxoacyl-[acyl-carrier protein] reductase
MKRVLITGGSGDWAKSFAAQFAEIYHIEHPGRAELDVTNEDSVQQFFASQTQAFDVVINNAGSIHPKRILESDSQKWVNDIQVNLIGNYYVSKYALSQSADTQLIHISSTAGFNAYKDWSSYCASKAGAITLSKSLSADGFNSVCLCPGAIDTKFRDYFDLPNNNMMTCEQLSDYVDRVINGEFNSGDVLFIRADEFKLNP